MGSFFAQDDKEELCVEQTSGVSWEWESAWPSGQIVDEPVVFGGADEVEGRGMGFWVRGG